MWSPSTCGEESPPHPAPLPVGEGVLAATLRSRLLSLELRHPLLLVRGDAFFRVVALKEKLLELALDCERGLDGKIPAGLDRAFDSADRLRRLVRRNELTRVVHDLFPPLLGRRIDDLVDEAELQGLLEREGVAHDH